MYKKYRVYVITSRGSYQAAAADSVNGLAPMVAEWLENTSVGRSVFDTYDIDPKTKQRFLSHSDVQAVQLYQLDEADGAYKFSRTEPANSRADIIRAVRALGAR